MPGIAGITGGDAPLGDHYNILRALRQVHELQHVTFCWKTFHWEHCAIANALTGLLASTVDQPAVDAADNTYLFLEGEIFNTEELLGYLKARTHDQTPCGILLALFLEQGTDFVSLVNGDFNIVIYQKNERRLVILNDHLSSKPMYYLEQGNCFLFGSELKSILAVAKKTPPINAVGLLQMFTHRHHVGGRTFLEGIKRMPPASRLEYHRGQLSLVRYSLMTFNVPTSIPKTALLIEEGCHLLKQAVWRRIRDKSRIVMSQSAGLDSRAIACAIPRGFRPISARTRGYPDSLEVTYASEIAKRFGFGHFREDPEAVPLSHIVHKIVWRTECMIPFINGITLANHAVIKEHGDIMCGGWLGDASSGAHLRSFMLLPWSRRRFIHQVYRWYILYSETTLDRVFSAEFLRRTMPDLRETFYDSFDPLQGETNSQLFEIWDLYERQTRMTLSAGAVDSHLFEYIRPFLDNDYLGFALALPPRLRYGQVLYQAMIHELGPEIRDIPNSNTNLKLKATIAGNMLNSGLAFVNKAKTRLVKKVLPASQTKFARADVGDLASIMRGDLEFHRIIEGFVRSSSFDSSIFNGPGILNMLDEHYQGVANYAHLLSILATFAVGLTYFVYSKPSHCPPEAQPLS